MNKVIINALPAGHRLVVDKVDRLSSGSRNVVQFHFLFNNDYDNTWADLVKTAVFYCNEDEVYHVLLENDFATVPHEVLAKEGAFYVGLMGTAEDIVHTTEAVRMTVLQGAITTPTADPEEPTPDIYSQLMQHYAVSQARVSELIAMRGTSGETVVTMSGDDYVKDGTIRLNGASAVLTFEIDGLTLVGYGEHSTDGCIQPAQVPLFPEGQDIPLHCSNPDLDVVIKKGEQGWSYIKIVNKTGSEVGVYGATCWGFFPLASVTLAEVVDARVDLSGKAWPTLGDHLRGITAAGMYYKHDYNGDGVVNRADEEALLNFVNFPEFSRISWWSDPDVNGDGVVDIEDVIAFSSALNNGAPSAFAFVPKEESILDEELNGTSVKPVQNKAISQEVSNALKTTASGGVVALTDVSPLEHEVKVQLKNKNLFPPQSYNEKNPTTSAGVTFTYNEDGSVLANGTATGNTAYYVCHGQAWENQMPISRGTYTLSGSTKNVRLTLGVRTHETAERVGKSSSAGQPLTFTVDNDTTRVDLVVCVDVGKTADNETVYPQLEAGDTATAYTPHVEGFSRLTLKKHGKNLIRYPYYQNKNTSQGIAFTANADGTVTANGTSTGFASILLDYGQAGLVLKKGVTYSVSGVEHTDKYVITVANASKTILSTLDKKTSKITPTEDIPVAAIRCVVYGGNTVNNLIFKPQLEIGEPTEYEPYKAETYTPNADGTVAGVRSLTPTTTLTTDNDGAIIEATYNRDANKVIESLEKKLTALSAAILNA